MKQGKGGTLSAGTFPSPSPPLASCLSGPRDKGFSQISLATTVHEGAGAGSDGHGLRWTGRWRPPARRAPAREPRHVRMGGEMGSFLFADTSLTPLLFEAHPSNYHREHKAPAETGCLLVATHVVLYEK